MYQVRFNILRWPLCSLTDHLFEVAVEVEFSQDAEESWDSRARSLLQSVKALVC